MAVILPPIPTSIHPDPVYEEEVDINYLLLEIEKLKKRIIKLEKRN